jgi:hypothetical protein
VVATPTNYNRAVVRSGNELVFMTQTQAWTLAADGHPRLGPATLPVDGPNGYGVWAVSANGTPVVYSIGTAGKLFTLGPNLEVVASINTSVLGSNALGTTLAWNGTNILLAQPDPSTTAIRTRRYTVDPLAGLDTASVPVAEDSVPLVVGRGGEFMLISYRSEGYTPPQYGIYTLPLNAGGRARATTEHLISITAYVQQQPLVTALPSGFVVTASEGPFYAGLMPLGTDGRPVAGRPASAGLAVDKGQRPYSIGAGTMGGTAVVGGNYGRVFGLRFDAQGAPLDPLPTQIMIPSWVRRGGIAWNGTRFIWACGGWEQIVGADGAFAQPTYLAMYIQPVTSVARAIGSTTLVAWLDTYIPAGGSGEQLKTLRLDAAGAPLDTTPNLIGNGFASQGSGLALVDDGTRYLALFDAVNAETSGALTSELRAIRIGANGKALDASPTVLRRATGGPPDQIGVAPPALSAPTLAYDGSLFWAVWRETGTGVWVRRIGGDGTVVDAQPVKVLDEPFGSYDIASRGDGKVLLVYDRFDPTPDVQVSRVKARMMGTTGTAGTGGGGGAGGAGGRGGGGGAGTGGRGGAGGSAAGAGGRGGAGGGGAGTSGAAGGGMAGSAAGGTGGASAGGAATGTGSGGTDATGGAPGTGTGGASAGSGGASAGGGGSSAGSAGTSGAGASDGGMTPGKSGGCSCAAAGGGSSGAGAVGGLAAALTLALARARRRRR